MHLVFEPPRGGFCSKPDAVAVSLCGGLPGLPDESYTSADVRPPERCCPRGFSAAEVAAALYAQRELPIGDVRLVRLLKPGETTG